MKRLSWLLAMLGSMALITGCAKQIPSADLNFETTQKVVITFRGGEEVQGKVAPGKKIELREPGVIWRARVGEVTEDKIVLKELTQIRVMNSISTQVGPRRGCEGRDRSVGSGQDAAPQRHHEGGDSPIRLGEDGPADELLGLWRRGPRSSPGGTVMKGIKTLTVAALALGISALLGLLVPPAALGQAVDTLGIQGLAIQSPSTVFRPLDMLGARAGSQGWSMGGAYAGQVEGIDAIAWNPAGLAWSTRPSLAVDFRWMRCSGTTKDFPDTFNLARIGQPNLLIRRYEVNLKGSLRGNLAGGAYSIEGPGGRWITGALSFRRYLNTAYPERIVSDMVLTQASGFPVTFAVDGKEDGGVDAIAASFACQVVPGLLSVGTNLNFLDGRLKGSREFQTSGGGTGVAAGTTTSFKYKGRSIDLGVQARSEQMMSIRAGLRFTPAYTVEVTSGKIFNFSRSLSPQFPGTELLSKVAGYDMEVPALLSFGGSVRPLRYLTLAFEYDKQNWADTKLTYRDAAFAETQAPPTLPLRNTASLHIGMELRLLKLRQIDLPVRFGFYSGALSMANLDNAAEFYDYVYTQKPIDRDIKTKGLTMGIGFVTGQIRYDLSYDILDYSFKRFYFDDPAPIPAYSFTNPNRILVRVDPRRTSNLRLTASLTL